VTSLLANCGLFVPCSHRSSIPEYDAYFLRTSSFDIPSEGKSSFAVEMSDLRAIMRDTSPHSLLMMDEIGDSTLSSLRSELTMAGRGTSTTDGAALSGAIIEWMSRKKCHGIFSTHILELVRLPLKATLQMKRMGVQYRGDCLSDPSTSDHTRQTFARCGPTSVRMVGSRTPWLLKLPNNSESVLSSSKEHQSSKSSLGLTTASPPSRSLLPSVLLSDTRRLSSKKSSFRP
jgi:hypothetical protein